MVHERAKRSAIIEGRTFGMVCCVIAGYSRDEIAEQFGVCKRWVSTTLNRPEARQMAVRIQKQIADRLVAERVARLTGRASGKINFTSILQEICSDVNLKCRKRIQGGQKTHNTCGRKGDTQDC